ncbi:MAG: GntR family transcriptional regulator [Gemmatimonadetes bacterium]|nr:GntR family transcriptional regulator [Gemmatimonadota bacterium]
MDRATAESKPQAQSLRETVYEFLRDRMNQGLLRPGSYLDLNALAEEIGTSRTPLRDALLRLESEGFVEIQNRKGVRVAALTLGSIRDIYEILGGLESVGLRSVAGQIGPDLIAHMEGLNEEMTRALDASDFARYYAANLAFHDAYLDLSTNTELVRRIHILKQRLYDFPRLKGFVPEWERASIIEHQELVESLRRGEVTQAADLLRDVHWSFTHQEPFIRDYYAATVSNGGAPD